MGLHTRLISSYFTRMLLYLSSFQEASLGLTDPPDM